MTALTLPEMYRLTTATIGLLPLDHPTRLAMGAIHHHGALTLASGRARAAHSDAIRRCVIRLLWCPWWDLQRPPGEA